MSYKKLNLTDLISAIQRKVESKTGLKCYDHVELNTKSPFYFAEVVRLTPANSKTMYRDNIEVYIHCIAEENPSSVGVYGLIDDLQEALSEDIELPEPFELIMQTDNGIQIIKTDETGEKHAVVGYTFMVCYGFICKI
jgi:hypothetical protein|uniref:DUF5072 domain-containing protein n=1 Tax=Siphoviridae sp. ctnNB1 TaxID=2825660 RepID=A0A8S5UVA6_9CAUD|nr:MAG TPA: hypothetical protein [Siphoviridae sp. ctnNB1]